MVQDANQDSVLKNFIHSLELVPKSGVERGTENTSQNDTSCSEQMGPWQAAADSTISDDCADKDVCNIRKRVVELRHRPVPLIVRFTPVDWGGRLAPVTRYGAALPLHWVPKQPVRAGETVTGTEMNDLGAAVSPII